MSEQKPTRYAIYFIPKPSSKLSMAGASWLGWDVESGTAPDHPNGLSLQSTEIATLTSRPRHYGFHGTFKPPFRLADGVNEDALIGAFEDYCKTVQGFALPAFKPSKIGNFYALVPSEPSRQLEALAGDVVEHFDTFRAPLTQADIEKRNPASLSENQRRLLDRWGYPYVFDEFRFHLTLTNNLESDDERIAPSINAHFQEALEQDNSQVTLALTVERNGAPFNLISSNTIDLL